jgi:hypothetical protein
MSKYSYSICHNVCGTEGFFQLAQHYELKTKGEAVQLADKFCKETGLENGYTPIVIQHLEKGYVSSVIWRVIGVLDADGNEHSNIQHNEFVVDWMSQSEYKEWEAEYATHKIRKTLNAAYFKFPEGHSIC